MFGKSKVKFSTTPRHGSPRAPFRKYGGDAGWDLYASREEWIEPGQSADIHTDIYVKLPRGMYIRITGRSSTLRKHNLIVNEAIIDNGYRGELYTCIHNLSDQPFHVTEGMRLAQMLLHRIERVEWQRVPMVDLQYDSDRGSRGFGSTGV